MAYRVKWKLNDKRETLQSRETYAVPADAVNFASTILPQQPVEIWIEGPDGLRIEREAISRASGDRRSSSPSRRMGTRH
jgi:hypothetical protein